MTVNEVLRYNHGGTVRVYFKKHDTRNVIIGRFVDLEDKESLLKSNFVRFVNKGKYREFESCCKMDKGLYAKIFSVKDFLIIENVVNEQKESNS